MKPVYLCGWGDGESHGRYLWEDNSADLDQAECPICGYPKTYHDCRWWNVTDGANVVIEKEQDGRWPTWAIRTLYSIRDPQTSSPIATLNALAQVWKRIAD